MPKTRREIDDVRHFMEKIGVRLPVEGDVGHVSKEVLRQRARFLQEELNEFKRAVESQDLVEQADAVADIVYVALGAALLLGLPWEPVWNEVARSNWEKEPASTARAAKDAVKPPGWRRPDIAGVLARFGYDRNAWTADGPGSIAVIDEEKCRGYE
jgi:predicted HAD superfamily Cof-like phosphohydrolase